MPAVNPERLPDALELDIPGELPSAPVRAAAPALNPQFIDRLLATMSVVVSPLVTAIALGLAWFGWYRITAFEIATLLVLHFVAITGVEVGFHRLFAHRSFEAHRAVRIALSIMGSFALQGTVIWWAATHRRHHRHSDRSGDPHTMHSGGSRVWSLLRGFYHAHMGWLFVPSSVRFEGSVGTVRDLYSDRDLFRVHVYYLHVLALGFLLPAFAGLLWYGTLKGAFIAFLWGGFVRVFFSNHLTYWSINSVSHSIGARPYVTADHSSNSIPVLFAIPTMGQSWHNNHHAFPSYWRMGHAWWQLDLGSLLISLLRRTGLAWGGKEPTVQDRERKRR